MEEIQQSSSMDELDKYLKDTMSMYSEPAKTVEPEPTAPMSTSAPAPATAPTPTTATTPLGPPVSSDPDAPYGRYKSGNKKGMPKPKPKNYVPPVPTAPVPPPVLSGVIIQGAMMLTLINLILPVLISILNNMFSDKKIKPEILQLTAGQKKELDPICDAVMKNASMSGNPAVLLFIGVTSAMGLNYLQWKIDQDIKEAKSKLK